MRHLIYNLLFLSAAGIHLSFGFVKHKEVGNGYYLIHGIIAAVLAVVALMVAPEPPPVWGFVFVICLTLFSLFGGKRKKLGVAAYFLGVITSLGTIWMDVLINTSLGLQNETLFNSLQALLILGFSLAALMLGHWYLTQPKMAIEELIRITSLLVFFICVRFVWGSYFTWQQLPATEAQATRFLFSGGMGTFLLMRWLWGLLLPLGLSYFILHTVKMRSTQSATGMLYVQTLFLLTGEILSLYLSAFHGVNL